MVVKIVTDSGSDLSEEITKDLDIAVVPLRVLFGDKDYRDGVDIKHEELYRRLVEGPVIPTTSTASPGEFADVFRKLSQEGAEGIVCIDISEKLSKTYGSALQAKEILETGSEKVCPIEVIDSQSITMSMGLLVMMAARLAKDGKSHPEIVGAVKENISRVHLMGVLDTLKYLIKGGRAPKVGVVSDVLRVKTFLKMRDGEFYVAGRTMTQREKMNRLVDFVKSFVDSGINEVAVEYSTAKEEAEIVKQEIARMLPRTLVHFGRVGSALGVHGGPGVIVVSVRTKT